MSENDPYLYPGTRTLRNRLGITDPRLLDHAERSLVAERISQPTPRGSFDLAHLRAIHRHLFQDVYDWAGELRTVEIFKGGNQFQFRQYIPTGMADVHRRLTRAGFLKHLPASEFARGGDHCWRHQLHPSVPRGEWSDAGTISQAVG